MIEIVKPPPSKTETTPLNQDTPVAGYSDMDLLGIMEHELGDIEELLMEALADDSCVGACASCGSIHDDVFMDGKNEFCDICGDYAVSSICVIAGVV